MEGSESRQTLALRGPVRRQVMPETPLGCEADGLRAIQNIANDVGRVEREADEMLDVPFRGAFAGSDLRDSYARLDPLEPSMRFLDVADQSVIFP